MFAHRDLWNIGAIIKRLDWQNNVMRKNDPDNSLWRSFAPCDIDLFHVEIRSLFDYLAQIIGLISDSPGQVPESFHKLRNWIVKGDNRQRLGDDLAQLALSCDWFDDMREVRNTIVHGGGFTMVFPEQNRILFQIYKGIRTSIKTPEIMYNENVVDFELYAGLYIGYLIAYLEKVVATIETRLNINTLTDRTKGYCPGVSVMQDWINKVLRI